MDPSMLAAAGGPSQQAQQAMPMQPGGQMPVPPMADVAMRSPHHKAKHGSRKGKRGKAKR